MVQTAPTEERVESLLDVEQNRPEPQSQSMCIRFQVAIVFVIFVVFRAADRVFNKDLSNELKNSTYNLVWSNIFWPFAVQILTTGLIGGYVLMQRWQGNKEYNCRFFLPNNPLASSKGAMPMYQLALFTLGDQLSAAFQAPASPFVAQAIQSVMSNVVIIWIAIIAYFWINSRYKQVHLVGMVLVVMACVVQFAPYITNNDCSAEALQKEDADCFRAYHSPLNGGQWKTFGSVGIMIFWYGLFLFSTAPNAVSQVYKQKVLQGCDADVFYVSFWSGWFQVLWGWLCIPLMWIPLPGQQTLKPSDTFQAIGDALSCIAGHVPHAGDETCAGSPPAWFWIILYLAFNMTFNLALTWLTKRMSAAWAQVGNVLCLNLCNIFSSWKFFMGSSAEPLSLYDWLSTILVSVALWVYNLEAEVTTDGKEFTQQAAGSFVADGHANIAEKIAGAKPGGSFAKQGSFHRSARDHGE